MVFIDKYQGIKGYQMNPSDYHKGSAATPTDIMEKIRYRLPMFLLVVHCSVIQILFGNTAFQPNDIQSATINKLLKPTEQQVPEALRSKSGVFISYYIAINILCVLWSLWHAIRAYNDNKDKIKCTSGAGFIACEAVTSLLLFIVVSNMTSFSVPFLLMFGFDQVTTTIICGLVITVVYFLNAIEETYWKAMEDDYRRIEQTDDIETPQLKPGEQIASYQTASKS